MRGARGARDGRREGVLSARRWGGRGCCCCHRRQGLRTPRAVLGLVNRRKQPRATLAQCSSPRVPRFCPAIAGGRDRGCGGRRHPPLPLALLPSLLFPLAPSPRCWPALIPSRCCRHHAQVHLRVPPGVYAHTLPVGDGGHGRCSGGGWWQHGRCSIVGWRQRGSHGGHRRHLPLVPAPAAGRGGTRHAGTVLEPARWLHHPPLLRCPPRLQQWRAAV